MSSRPERALVLGGGVAGIAAALLLHDRGIAVTLFESRRGLGGRVFSLADGPLGILDNGPHVMLGCYDHMRRLLRRLGTELSFERPESLTLVYRDDRGHRTELALARRPVPLAMPLALMTWRALGLGDRLRALRGLASSLRGAPVTWSIEDWIRTRRQHGAPREYLWDPLCRAIMNAHPADVSADLFLRTLRRAFSGSSQRSAIWLPRRPWDEIVGEPARDEFDRCGIDLRTGHRVVTIERRGGAVQSLLFADGQRLPVGRRDLVVSAMPWHRLARVLDESAPALPQPLAGRAIVNVYFEVDPTVALPDDGPLVALVRGAPFHFLYRTPGAPNHRFALIAGASPELDGIGVAQIVAMARAQIARHYPGHEIPESARVRVTKESAATVLAAPGSDAARLLPGPLDGCENLLVCGDWTRTGLPSTLEGAAESAALMLAGYDDRRRGR